MKNQFELVTAAGSQLLSMTRKPVWASFNNQEEPFELVTASFNDKEKLVWASYSQFQQAVRTRKNQFELVTASFNDKEKLVWASYSQFQQLWANSFNDKEKPVWS